MDEGKSKKLSRLIWLSRLRIALPVLAIFLGLVGITMYFVAGEKIPDGDGTFAIVNSWSRLQSETGSSTYVIDVTLEDGRKVVVTASAVGRSPRNGERIRLSGSKTAFGRVIYRWDRTPRDR